MSVSHNLELVLNRAGLGHAPTPEPAALDLHYQLVNQIRSHIMQAGGAISFAAYMQLALYAPGLGYYVSGTQKFGPMGDFITAPETSDVFGFCVAQQCIQVLQELRVQGQKPAILEFGPGTGKLCVQILTRCKELGVEVGAYYLLELSPSLRQRQYEELQTRVPELMSCVVWLESVPESFTGIMLANEVLDAMPTTCFKVDVHGLQERGVRIDPNEEMGFIWCDLPPNPQLVAEITQLEKNLSDSLVPDYISEINLWVEPWLVAVADGLSAGVLLIIDYGYTEREFYHPQRSAGTLMCHYRHRAHDQPLILAGLQDITSFVDFSRVAHLANKSGLENSGFTSQAQFLIGSGLDEIAQQTLEQSPEQYRKMAQDIKTLTLPGQMGERFRVLALSKQFNTPLRGFKHFDYSHRL